MTAAAAGKLPTASCATMRQSTRRLKPKEAVATSFVLAENKRSVPTATAGGSPKTSTSKGVIKDPPPTPVRPTRVPTIKPQRAYARGIDMGGRVYPGRGGGHDAHRA